MEKGIYRFVFLALKTELEERGYKAHGIEALIAEYSWFLSRYFLLRDLLRSRLPIEKYQQSLDFLFNRHEALGNKIRSGSTVLDIGCGAGLLACFLAKRNCRIYGTDIQDENLSVAARLSQLMGVTEYCAFQKAESSSLPFNSAMFDYVVFSWTFHEIKAADRDPLVSECVRVLKHNGVLLVLDQESQLDFEELDTLISRQPMRRVQRKALSDVYDHGALSKAILAIYRKEGQRKKRKRTVETDS